MACSHRSWRLRSLVATWIVLVFSTVVAWIVLAFSTAGLAEEPDKPSAPPPQFYARMASWQETMLNSRAAMNAPSTFKPFASEIIRGSQPATQISVNIAGLRRLWLVATDAGDNYAFDCAIWADAKLIAKDGSVVFLDTLEPVSSRVGWGVLLHNNKNGWDGPLQIAGKQYKRGIFAHAVSEACYIIDGKYERFEAKIGIDDYSKKRGTVVFKVIDRSRPATHLWKQIELDYPMQAQRMKQDTANPVLWFNKPASSDMDRNMIARALAATCHFGQDMRAKLEAMTKAKVAPSDRRWLDLYVRACDLRDQCVTPMKLSTLLARLGKNGAGLQKQFDAIRDAKAAPSDPRWKALLKKAIGFEKCLADLRSINLPALRRAIDDLATCYGEKYSRGREFLARLDELDKQMPGLMATIQKADEAALGQVEAMRAFQHEALLANPLLDFDKLLLVKRKRVNAGPHGGHVPDPLGLPQNWQSNSSIARTGWDNEIDVLSPVRPDGKLTTLYTPDGNKFVGDVDLNFDADKMLFSSIGTHNHWQVFEVKADGTGLRQVTPGKEPDVSNYDACYLPNGRIIFTSTAPMQAVACVNGADMVAMIFRMNADGSGMRQLAFDQEHSWCPTVLNNGRVLYARWEYTDTPHAHDRVLFHMNPDGTAQMEYYKSNSYWPNSIFYARPIPGEPTKVVAIGSGHHGVRRMGELLILDPAKGRFEADGVVQRIPGYGKKVEPIVADALVDKVWPRFLHPYPLSDKYFLVSCQPTPESAWGIYLVDVFDNILLIKEAEDYALLEPIPFRKTPRPPVIPDRVDLSRKDAMVYLQDIYIGDGLKGVPRSTVKKLRLFTYNFDYPGHGGPQGVVGMDGPWDVKRIIGTVPVNKDGSVFFRVPANTPIALQPLDSEGKALALMRSWFTSMPGETVSCVGCHERQNTAPSSKLTLAARQAPANIRPWHGKTRGFAFAREVQPVLDKYCISCHDGQKSGPGSKPLADLRGVEMIKDYSTSYHASGYSGRFSISYGELHRYCRRGGLESDYHMLPPMEFHADQTQLVQMLQKGHHNVKMDKEAWDRLITWIDLNCPYQGTWYEIAGMKSNIEALVKRRRELRKKYAGMDDDFEFIPDATTEKIEPVIPEPEGPRPKAITFPGWPFNSAEAKKRQVACKTKTEQTFDLPNGMKLVMILVPAGEFVMGDPDGLPDEWPLTRIKIEKSFWMGKLEISNKQYAIYDPAHDSRLEHKNAMQFGVRGFPLNKPRQPVVRISWRQAMAFCKWLSKKTGRKFTLPTEAQWEYACRAGTGTSFYYGGMKSDFSDFANLGDQRLRDYVNDPYSLTPMGGSKYDDWVPKDNRFDDGSFVSAVVGKYAPNAWGLQDMTGNVWEWTLSSYRPYPYREKDDRNDLSLMKKKVARGGSWYDRPMRARSSFRLPYRSYQKVYNVGFRVVMEAKTDVSPVAATDKDRKTLYVDCISPVAPATDKNGKMPNADYLSPIALVAGKDGKTLYVAEYTGKQIAVLNVATRKVAAKAIALGGRPGGLAMSADGGTLFVTLAEPAGKVLLIDVPSLGAKREKPVAIAVGHTPLSPVLSRDGKRLYVCNRFSNSVSIVDLETKKEVARVAVPREPVACALTPDGKLLFVANHLPTGPAHVKTVAATVSVIDTATKRVSLEIKLPNGSMGLRGMAISPDGKWIYVTHILARYQLPTTQLERGWMNTNAMSVIDAVNQRLLATVLLDDVDLGAANPWAIACTANGKSICITHAGSHELSVIDRTALHEKLDKVAAAAKMPEATTSLATVCDDLAFLCGIRKRYALAGQAPRGLTLAGNRAYMAEYFSDSIGVVDLASKAIHRPRSIAVGPVRPMTAARKGEMLFNDANACFQKWQSCATCHPDARTDGLNWDLLNDGIGNPKNTKSMLLSPQTPPVMNTGIRKDSITAVRAGMKFIQFAVHSEKDALAINEYLRSLKPVPSPHLVNGQLSEAARSGRKVFEAASCSSCHSGPLLTDLRQYNVGTGTGNEAKRAFDTPSLIELWRTAPYLYDGRAKTIQEVLTRYNTGNLHGRTSKLSKKELADLAEYMLSQ